MSVSPLPPATAQPGAVSRVGVLLVNLGTPDTADAAGVRVYLKEFLSDPRVIEDQGLLWKLVLNGIILRTRPRRKAQDYLKIWNNVENESPLKTISRSQATRLAAALADYPNVVVDWAMRYGNPSLRDRIMAMTAQGCDRILVVPLYPQYSAATSATVCDEVFRVLASMRAQPSLRVSPPYFDEPVYIEAVASSMEACLATLPFQPDVILASFHGMPQKYVDKGDPYYEQCVVTTEKLRARLGMDDSRLPMSGMASYTPGMEITGGSLGQGLGIAIGMALGLRRKRSKAFVYNLMSDGELGEGSTWEAAMVAAHHRLGNLICLVDFNNQQADGKSTQMLSAEPVEAKWRAFGWHCQRVDGNDLDAVVGAFDTARAVAEPVPRVIIFDTRMCKGVPFLERREIAHFVRVEADEWVKALSALEEGRPA